MILQYKAKPKVINGQTYIPIKAKYSKTDCITTHELSNTDLFDNFINKRINQLRAATQGISSGNILYVPLAYLPNSITIESVGFLYTININVPD